MGRRVVGATEGYAVAGRIIQGMYSPAVSFIWAAILYCGASIHWSSRNTSTTKCPIHSSNTEAYVR